jgi:DNA-binding LytR/AlgR family response regulator
MKILFLDDNVQRLMHAKKKWFAHDLILVETSYDAIEALKKNNFDFVSLDHDLGGKEYVPSGENTGYEVAQFIAKMKNPPPIVVVHSWNSVGARKMVQELENVTEVDYQPFLM